ncbi:MAG TPA: hypothetical protein VLE72_00070 [Candidatus Saccharimonadales bacterium]|nr:hypothetical protein [Candidatus Saccharimonadales bacterium]
MRHLALPLAVVSIALVLWLSRYGGLLPNLLSATLSVIAVVGIVIWMLNSTRHPNEFKPKKVRR